MHLLRFLQYHLLKLRDDYTDALCREMQMRPAKAALGSNETIETIYLGGGTPSQLNGSHLNQIFSAIRKNYTLAENMEITMECNPDDVTGDFCETLEATPHQPHQHGGTDLL